MIKTLAVHNNIEKEQKDKSIIIEEIYERNVNMVYRVSFSYMKNKTDTDDIVSEIFLKLIKTKICFQNEEHEKAWLLRTTINLCKDSLKSLRRKNKNIDDYINTEGENQNQFEIDETFKIVMQLPGRYKDAIYLYYYEGYSTEEIARILKKPNSTIRNHLHEARNLLKGVLENEK
ncbi:MAG: RNA polymerase sigma factor [Oscillospiraceae bacterium]|nr:RNA polymerase sigma factor [Oscillospiraceae bacterium]